MCARQRFWLRGNPGVERAKKVVVQANTNQLANAGGCRASGFTFDGGLAV